jgi:hypothetical protein
VIFTQERISAEELERRTGWTMKAEGLCRGEVCVPFAFGDGADLASLAEALRMPLVNDAAHGLWCLGPPATGKALETAAAPELVLPDLEGNQFTLSSLWGQKVLLVAWASW